MAPRALGDLIQTVQRHTIAQRLGSGAGHQLQRRIWHRLRREQVSPVIAAMPVNEFRAALRTPIVNDSLERNECLLQSICESQFR